MQDHKQQGGYDYGEPRSGLIALFGIAAIVLVVVAVFAIQVYYDHVREKQLYEKVLAPVSDDLRSLRAKEDGELHSYGYADRDASKVRIPIERAMELLEKEAAAGKLAYPTKPAPVKVVAPAGAQPQEGDAPHAPAGLD